jgi:HK97 family phage portal protein
MFFDQLKAATTSPKELERIWLQHFGTPTKAGVVVTQDTAMRVSAVFACIRVLAETVGQLPLILYRRLPDKGKERVTDHPLAQLMMRPNHFQTRQDFTEMLTGHTALRGNGYAFKNIVGGRVVELLPFRPDQVTPRINEFQVIHYDVQLKDGGKKTYTQDQIFHLKGFSGSGFVGDSVLAHAKESIGTAIAIKDHGARFFKNGGKFTGIITHPGHFEDDDAIKRFQRSWDVRTSGDDAWSTAVLEDGLKWEKVGMSNEDSQFLESGKFSVEDIARFFRMQLHKIQSMDKATFSNIEQQALEFVVDTMMPWLVRWELNISAQLIDPAERDELFMEFLVEGLLRGDSKARSEFYKSAIFAGWMNRNEPRIKENMNPVDGLEDFLQPSNMQDVGENKSGDQKGEAGK